MHRRSLIQRGGIAGVLAAGLAPAVQAQPLTRWRLASSFAGSQDLMLGAAESLARRVGEMSGRRFQIEVHAAGELMSAQGVLDGVQRGAIEACHTAGSFFVDQNEAFAVGAGLPFGMNARQLNAWMVEGNGGRLRSEFLAGFGAVGFACGSTGAQRLGWFVRELGDVRDLRGLKVRFDGLAGRTLARLGARQVPGGADARSALVGGSVGAAEGWSPHDDLRLGLPKAARVCHYPGWGSGALQLDLLVNQKAFDALGAEDRAILRAASAAVQAELLARYDARNTAALRQIAAAGVRFKPLPRPVLEALFRASMDLCLELERSKPAFRKLHADYRAFQHDQLSGDRFTEAAFDAFLQNAKL